VSEVGAEGTRVVLVGGTSSVDWARPTLGRIQHLLLDDESGLIPSPVHKVLGVAPVRRAVEQRLEGLDRLLADPEFVYLAPTLVSAWGRRPATS
jgi:hypothetical protein